MKGKLLRGISGSTQPRRLLHGYQDAVFAWSGEDPFANLAQSTLYRILPRTQYSDSWIKSTPHGQAFRANNYSGSGHGYVFSSHVPSADITYAAGVTGYAEYVYSANLQENQFVQHLCCISSSADGNTGDTYYGVLTFGLENYSGLCPVFRAGNNTRLYGFAGGSSDSGAGTLVPVSIPIGTKVRQVVAFDPVSKAYASILTFNDVVYEGFGTVPNGFASTGSSILVGGYPRNGVRAAYVSGMLEAAIWNRTMQPAEMYALLQRPSIFQPTEFIFPFSFGEAPAGSEVINTTPAAIALSPIQAGLYSTEILNTSADALSLTPAAANLQTTLEISTAPAGLSIAGMQAGLISNGVLNTQAEALSLTPAVASILGTVTVLTNPATISLSGVNADINLSGQTQIPTIPATITLVANSATLVQHAVINAHPDALVLAPVAAGLYAGEAVVDTAAKALTLTPDQAAIVQHSVLATTAGNIGLHGAQAELHLTNVLATNTATIGLSGAQAWLYSTEILSSKPDSISLQGNQALIQASGVVDTWPDNLGIFGQKADVSMSMVLATNLVNMTFAGLRAQINYQSPLVWGGTTIEARLQGMTIEARLQDMTIEARQ